MITEKNYVGNGTNARRLDSKDAWGFLWATVRIPALSTVREHEKAMQEARREHSQLPRVGVSRRAGERYRGERICWLT